MNISLVIHYRGDKARLFNEHKDNADKYLELFVAEDLKAFGIPMPQSCRPTWRSGFIKCNWTLNTNSPLRSQIAQGFQVIRVSQSSLTDRSISQMILNVDGQTSIAASATKIGKAREKRALPGKFTPPAASASSSRTLYSRPYASRERTTNTQDRLDGMLERLAKLRESVSKVMSAPDGDHPMSGKDPATPTSISLARNAALPYPTVASLPAARETQKYSQPKTEPDVGSSRQGFMAAHSILDQPGNHKAIVTPAGEQTQASDAQPSITAYTAPESQEAPAGSGLSSAPVETKDLRSTEDALRAVHQGMDTGSMQTSAYSPIAPHSKSTSQPGSRRSTVVTDTRNSTFHRSEQNSSSPRKPSRSFHYPTSAPITQRSPSPSSAKTTSPSSLSLSARSAATSTSSLALTVGGLTRELWDVRREVTALRAREASLAQQLRHMGSTPAPTSPVGPSTRAERRASEGEIASLRAQLKAESEARHATEAALQVERRRRELAESVVDDARRECTKPFVVPALMDAFVQLSHLTDDIIAKVELDCDIAM